jgi:phenylalanyl-tRNA synthetase beta chain
VTLLNPISPERSTLRRTLIPGLLTVAVEQLKNASSVKIFELGPVFQAAAAELPREPRRLSLVLTGTRAEVSWDDPQNVPAAVVDFYDLKGTIEAFLQELHLPIPKYNLAADVPYLHPGRSAKISLGSIHLGQFGVLHPRTSCYWKLTDRVVLVAELDLDEILKAIPERYPYQPISSFPPVLRDLAVVVDEALTADRVVAEIHAGGGDLLEAVRLFDVYRGDSIPPGTKSLAFALTYRRPDRQLADKEVDKAHEKIEGRLKNVLKGTIRGK